MATRTAAHSEVEKSVGTTHVPVTDGHCCVVPDEVFDDPERFGLWCRAYGRELFENEAWQGLARRHFGTRIDAAREGDDKALTELLGTLPELLHLPEVQVCVVRLLVWCESAWLVNLASALGRKHKRIMKTVEPKCSGVNALRPTKAMERAGRTVGGARTLDEFFSDAKMLSERKLMARALREASPDGSQAVKTLQTMLGRSRGLMRFFPRAVTRYAECSGHRGRTTDLFNGGEVPIAKAPRLILGPHDERAPGEGRSLRQPA